MAQHTWRSVLPDTMWARATFRESFLSLARPPPLSPAQWRKEAGWITPCLPTPLFHRLSYLREHLDSTQTLRFPNKPGAVSVPRLQISPSIKLVHSQGCWTSISVAEKLRNPIACSASFSNRQDRRGTQVSSHTRAAVYSKQPYASRAKLAGYLLDIWHPVDSRGHNMIETLQPPPPPPGVKH